MPDASSQPARPKKRVRTLSHVPDGQTGQMRSVDRRAERAFRQQTRDCITGLEERLAMLTESAARREAELVAEVRAWRQQCQMLKRCLDSIVDIASGVDPAAEETENNDSSDSNHGDVDHNDNDSNSSNNVHHLVYSNTHREPSHAHDHSKPQSLDTGGPADAATPSHQPRPVHKSSLANHHTQLPSPAGTQPLIPSPASQWADHNTSNPGAYIYPISSTPFCAPAQPSSSSSFVPPNISRAKSAVSSILPQHLLPTCPLDRILLDFLKSRKDMIAEGVPMETILGPQKAIMTGLIDPSLAPSVHPVSRMLSEVLTTFPNVALPQKMGMFYKIYLTMRWQISPTTETYTQMPVWLRPTATQIAVPHAAWIDNLPWPGIRDLLIEYPEKYPFEIFSEYYSQNVTVNWHFDESDAVAHEDGNVVLHSIFEKHIRNLANWTVSHEFESRFPEMSHIIFARG
ncbi:hypothetical protein BKA66DRAFT_190383 [Pyrenochaeta sp. MPI-SDFR-AT-0127]|nr:hypothetical protein BKA66DRAFT_190383 [Pyrenochaeta sp. MPI-SDFR-AT-0127]